jgi:putative oxidoreductase
MSATTLAPTPQSTRTRTAADTALLLVRIGLAIPFLYHGAQILFGAFGGPGLHGFVQASHDKMPLPVAALVGAGEFFGGLGVLCGVLTRLASAGILIIMVGAIFLVHWPHGYSVSNGGFEYPLVHVFLTLALITAGPGALTAWTAIGRAAPARPILQ